MKRLLSCCALLALVSSFSIAGRSYAAHQGASSHAGMMAVRLCTSTPVSVPPDTHLSRGIFHGVELATAQWRSRFSKAGMNLLPPVELDYSRADGSGTDPAKEHTNALACVGRSDTFGYVGTLNSSIAQISEPITNRAGMVMISPSNSAVVLTAPNQRQTYEPQTYNHKLKYVTYYRTVTTDALQGPGGAQFLHNFLHANTYFLVDDGQTYGVGLVQHMSAFASRIGMKEVASGRVDSTSSSSILTTSNAIADQVVAKKPDALYCGCNLENMYALAKDARRKGYQGPIIGGDAIYDPTWIKDVGQQNTFKNFATFVGPDVSASSAAFRRAYKQMFPSFVIGPYDAASYDAANIELQAIMKAHMAGRLTKGGMFQRRASVLPYVAQVRWHGALGLTTFDRNGDTTNRIISIFQVKNGNWAYLGSPKLPADLRPTA